MATVFLKTGPQDGRATILLAHGAGAAMDAPGMNGIADALVTQNLAVVRFEFAYMAARRTDAGRKPPPRAERVMPEFVTAIEALDATGPLFIGGKSMGGRVATMVADACFTKGLISGVVCMGYPFHPPAKPDKLRTAHLECLTTPALIFQGTRDPFGKVDEVPNYSLSSNIELVWMEDGDHDLKPRKRETGKSHADHLNAMAANLSEWIDRLS